MADEGTVLINSSDQLEMQVEGTAGAHRLRSQMDNFDFDFTLIALIVSLTPTNFAATDTARAGIFCDIDHNDIFIQLQFVDGTGFTWEWDINGTTGSAAVSSSTLVEVMIKRTADLVEVFSEGVSRATATVSGTVRNLSMRTEVASIAPTAFALAIFDNFIPVDAANNSLTSPRIIFRRATSFTFVASDPNANVTEANIEFETALVVGNATALCTEFKIDVNGAPYCTETIT